LDTQNISKIKDILDMNYYKKEDDLFFPIVGRKAIVHYFKVNDIDCREHSYLLRRFKPYERKAINALDTVKNFLDSEEVITSSQLINALKEIKKSLAFIQNVLDSNYTRANQIMQLNKAKLVA
jgi:glycyl-tRNA synthetase alpha subunit